MSYYDDVYLKRLNRFGFDQTSRIQGQREKEFNDYLRKSVYQVSFKYNNTRYFASLEPYQQDKTRTVAYLLIDRHISFDNGTILTIPNDRYTSYTWMVWWMDNAYARGYNRYVLLQMNNEIHWIHSSLSLSLPVYFFGPGTGKIKDTVASSGAEVRFLQNNNLYTLVAPVHPNLTEQDYIELTVEGITKSYKVSGIDIASTPGVEYISLDPTYKRDSSTLDSHPIVEQAATNWLHKGEEE